MNWHSALWMGSRWNAIWKISGGKRRSLSPLGLSVMRRIALANILSPRPNVNAWIKCVVDQASKEMPPEEIGETKGDNKTV